MEYWELMENPTGEVYRTLLKVLCDNSDQFYFITRKELKYNQAILAQFEPYMLKTYTSKEWASTLTKGPAATIFVMESNEETYALLVEHANALYDWISPRLPEDLTFMKNNFEWFSCTTHEEFGGFSIRSDYYRNLLCGITGLNISKSE